MLAGVAIGAVPLPVEGVIATLADRIGLSAGTPLTGTNATLLTDLRLPRVVLAAMVGGMLAIAGAAYQGVFRNPLADPYLLGVLRVRDVGVRFGRSQILDGVRLDVPAGGWTSVIGPNGAGKSTLLKAIVAAVAHTGSITIDGVDVAGLSGRQRARLIGYAPQRAVLPDGISVADYVLLGRTAHSSLLTAPRAVDRREVDRAIDLLDLGALAGRTLRTLSGGESQRAVLARVLAQRPRLVVLDEPTSALDLGHAQGLLELIDGLRRSEGITVLSTLHDLVLAGQYAQRLVLLDRGAVVADGPATAVLTEENLRTHYGATVRVVTDAAGVHLYPIRVSDRTTQGR